MRRTLQKASGLCVALLLCLAACAPTPTVAQKTTATADPLGALAKQEAMLADAGRDAPAAEAIPATVSADMACADARRTVTGEATVSVLGDGPFPIVRVKPAAFTNRQVRRLLRALMPGARLYEVGNVRDKAHVQAAIEALAAQKADYDAQEIEGYAFELLALKEELAAAPEAVAKERASKKLRPVTRDYGNGNAKTHMGLFVGESPIYGDPVRYLSVDNSEDTLYAEYREIYGQTYLLYEGNAGGTAIFDDLRAESRYYVWALLGAVEGDAVPAECAGMLSLTPAQAARRAERICKSAGFDARATSVTLVKGSRQRVQQEEDFDADGYCYDVCCTRIVDGAQSVYLSGSAVATGGMGAGVVFGTWAFESARFSIDDRGVFRMDWSSPHTVTETLVKKAALLPFSEIMERFRQSEETLFSKDSANDHAAARLTLTRAELGLVRVPAYDEPDSGLLIPAWAFYGTMDYTYPGGYTERENGGGDAIVLMLNAVTGEAVNPEIVS